MALIKEITPIQRNPGSRYLFIWFTCLLLLLVTACTPRNPPPDQPSASRLPTPTPFPPPPASLVGETWLHPVDEMRLVFVPEGLFIMGARDNDPNADDTEFPLRTVFLNAYWIDQTEVTNGMYALCVLEGGCTPPALNYTLTRTEYYQDLSFAEYPVVHVTWEQAAAYCGWAGRRLPTEAEWEKAARGTDGRTYPWGDDAPTCERLRFGDPGPGQPSCEEDTARTGSFELGISPFGVLDMAGNVWEWTADWYAADAYRQDTDDNPMGPELGDTKVLRGGAFNDSAVTVRSANRHHTAPNNPSYTIGFRCAISARAP